MFNSTSSVTPYIYITNLSNYNDNTAKIINKYPKFYALHQSRKFVSA